MLGLGIESVGYSSARSELTAGGEAETNAQSTGTVERKMVFAGAAIAAALVVVAAKADFYSGVTAAAHGYALNTQRLLTSFVSGEAQASSFAIGWQEAKVFVEPQEALATATLLGLPDGYYAEGTASAEAVLEAAGNRVLRGTGSGIVSTSAIGNERVTRNAASSIHCQASAYGEWQINSELFATGQAIATAGLSAQIKIYPSLEPLIGGCTAVGSAHVRFVESSEAMATAQVDIVHSEHRQAAFGESLGIAAISGRADRVLSLSGKPANAMSYSAGAAMRRLVPYGSASVTADLEGSAHLVSFLSGSAVAAAEFEGTAVKYLVGEVDAVGEAVSQGGAKLNDYYPAPNWRRLVVDARPAAITIDSAIREVVV